MSISGTYHGLEFSQNDGGRLEAGFKGRTGDCATRAIAIATHQPYRKIYNALANTQAMMTGGLERSVRDGVGIPILHHYMTSVVGWDLYRTDGEYLTSASIPMARVVVCVLPRHFVTVIDGRVCDSWDCRRSSRTKNGAQRLLGFYMAG